MVRRDALPGGSGDLEGLDLSLWGKSEGLPPGIRYPLICHLVDAAAAMEALWRDHVAPGSREAIAAGLGVSVECAGRLLAFWAALHDIGKITYGFQALDAASPIQGYPADDQRKSHDHAAAEWLQYVLPEYGYPGDGRRPTALTVAQILGGHHGRFHRHAEATGSAALHRLGYRSDAWETQRRLHTAAVGELLAPPPPPERIDGPVAALVCGLIIQADWLVSQLSFVKSQLAAGVPAGPEDLPRHLERARDRLPGVLAAAGLTPCPTRAGCAKPHARGDEPSGPAPWRALLGQAPRPWG